MIDKNDYKFTFDNKTTPKKPSRLVTRKLYFSCYTHDHASVTQIACKAAFSNGRSIKKYKLRKFYDNHPSYIVFRCPEENWSLIVQRFLSECGNRVVEVTCNM